MNPFGMNNFKKKEEKKKKKKGKKMCIKLIFLKGKDTKVKTKHDF